VLRPRPVCWLRREILAWWRAESLGDLGGQRVGNGSSLLGGSGEGRGRVGNIVPIGCDLAAAVSEDARPFGKQGQDGSQ
jgi:hypothetical protein